MLVRMPKVDMRPQVAVCEWNSLSLIVAIGLEANFETVSAAKMKSTIPEKSSRNIWPAQSAETTVSPTDFCRYMHFSAFPQNPLYLS